MTAQDAIQTFEATGKLPGSVFQPPGVTNLKRSNTNKYRAARGRVQSGAGNGRICVVGNSIAAGYGATGNGSLSNMASKSWPTQLAQILNTPSFPASWSSWCGGNNYTDFAAADSRIVMGGWTNAGLGTFGGNTLQLAATGQTLMSFTPLNAVDTIEVLGLANNNVAITIAVDGGATIFTYNPFASGTGQVRSSGARALGGAPAAHAIQANISSAGSTYLVGMIAWNSLIKEMQVLRAGWHGAVAANFNQAAWTYTDGLKAVAPDCTIISPVRNDPGQNTDVGAFRADVQKIITAAKVSGDVILMIEPLGALDPRVYRAYVSAMYQLSGINDCPLIDYTQLFDDYANTNSWYGDGIHPVQFSYGEIARHMANLLTAV